MIDTSAENWLNELLPQVVKLAREAGEAILAAYAEADPRVEFKPDNSPLTKADLQSHRVILDGLRRLSPEWPILSEESEEVPFDRRESWRCFWLVDPLDGTKEFLGRTGEFTVNIALVEANRPILGVVFAPAVGKLYFAARGACAFRADRHVVSQIRAARPGMANIRTVVSRSHRLEVEDLGHFIEGAESCNFIVMGSSMKFCLVAEGTADLYPRMSPTMEWDTAAAQCILEEAGGLVTDLDGNPLRYNKPIMLNPAFVARGLSRGNGT